MKVEEIIDKLEENFKENIIETKKEAKDPFIKIKPSSIKVISKFLKENPLLSFDFLQNMCAVDMMGVGGNTHFMCVYHLFSYKYKHSIVMKVDLQRDNPEIQSVCDIWASANWYEREVYDLFGINFKGHPDLRRILLPPEWEGHPLRKDYKERESTLGISTSREMLVDKIKGKKDEGEK